MGCGAVCGSSSSVAENSKQAQRLFLSLFKQIMPNPFLYPIKAIAKFTKQIQLNPNRFQIILTQKLHAKCPVSVGVMQKWKIILFGLDCDRPTYVNCLGYPENVLKPKPSGQKQLPEQLTYFKEAAGQQNSQQINIIQHKAFTQIEKDIERTFQGIDFQKNSFTMILKRITNHFPVMGYTQGINFLIGYLLIIGYSQNDAFWLFTHMAINRRYLMLGLYQDGFPLINVYTCIFRSILKRTNQKLYRHLYENITMFQQSAWVFKWFMTCYLSSFPIQMCQYVWDLVISIGGIGLVKFAISIVSKLEKYLLEYDDACDITQFFSSLKQIEVFNKYLSIREIINNAYKVTLQKQDIQQLNEVKTQRGGTNFYAEYFILRFQQQENPPLNNHEIKHLNENKNLNSNNQKEMTNQLNQAKQQLHQTSPILFRKLSARRSSQLLNQWYKKLLKQRNQFKQKSIYQRKKSNVNSYFMSYDNKQSQILGLKKNNTKQGKVPKINLLNIRQLESQSSKQMKENQSQQPAQNQCQNYITNPHNQIFLTNSHKKISTNIVNKRTSINSWLGQSQKNDSLHIIQQQFQKIQSKQFNKQRSTHTQRVIQNSELSSKANYVNAHENTASNFNSNQNENNNLSTNKLKNRLNIKKANVMWVDEDQQLQKQQNKDKIMGIQDQFFYIPRDIRFKRKNVTHQSDDILSNYIDGNLTKKNSQVDPNKRSQRQPGKTQVLRNTYLKPQLNIESNDKNSTNLNNSRLAKAGHSVISSNMSISNASNKSSTSSYRTTQKESSLKVKANSKIVTHMYTRQCKCVKNKTQCNIVEDINILNQQISKSPLELQTKEQKIHRNMQKKKQAQFMTQNNEDHEHQYDQSLDQININRKRVNTYQDWMVNSQGPSKNFQFNTNGIQNSHVKQQSQAGTQIEIIQGDYMFKKKKETNKINCCNKIGPRELGCIHDCTQLCKSQVKNSSNIEQISEIQSGRVITPGLVVGQQQSCESFMIASISVKNYQYGGLENGG